MLKPDEYFRKISFYFPIKNQRLARQLFRRAIRDYYVMQRQFVVDPETGKRVNGVFVGKFIQLQKKQRRLVTTTFQGRKGVGRPIKLEIKVLISRLFIFWGRFASTQATLSWKTKSAVKTDFEEFLLELLPRLGAPDVRRYVEAHWKARK